MSLAVICCHFNPSGYREPRRNTLRFLRQMESLDVPVFVSELAYDDESFYLPASSSVFRFRTKRRNVLWHKENLLNLTVQSLPAHFLKIAWIDPDVWFMNRNWLADAERALDRFPIVQLFSESAWTDRDGKLHRWMKSCASLTTFNLNVGNPGFAWAARRGLWDSVGGLYDQGILGGGDTVIAAACAEVAIPGIFYYPYVREWRDRFSAWIQTNGGSSYIDGVLIHEWHGDVTGRNYKRRYESLGDVDVSALLCRRQDGLIEYASSAPQQIMDAIRRYFDMRCEDGDVKQL